MKKIKIKYKGGSVYYGEVHGNLPNGKGTYKDRHGKTIYSGHWIAGLPGGYGNYTNPDGELETGIWFRGAKVGNVTIKNKIANTTEKIQATTKKTKYKDLQDEIHNVERNIYAPIFKKTGFTGSAAYHGKTTISKKASGLWYLIDEKELYLTNFKKDRLSGHGVIVYINGDCKIGNFHNNIFEGSDNKMFYSNGDYYHGSFKDGKREGYGVFHNNKTGEVFRGNWLNDKMNGTFKITKNKKERERTYAKGIMISEKKDEQKTKNQKPKKDSVKSVRKDKTEDTTNNNNQSNLLNGKGEKVLQDGTKLVGTWKDDLPINYAQHLDQDGNLKNKYFFPKSSNLILKKEVEKIEDEPFKQDNLDYSHYIEAVDSNRLSLKYMEKYSHNEKEYYMGEIENKIPNGYGVHSFEDEVYEGFWKNNSRNGAGIKVKFDSEGNKQITFGVWENDTLVKQYDFHKQYQYISTVGAEVDNINSNNTYNFNNDISGLKVWKEVSERKNNLEQRKKELERLIKNLSLQNDEPKNNKPKEDDAKSDLAGLIKNNKPVRPANPKQIKNKPLTTEEKFIEKKFKGYIGVEDVKEQLKNIISLKRIQGDNFKQSDMHMAFLGNPGTGKTSVARLFAEVLHGAGIIQKNKLVEVSFASLYGAYVGHSLKAINEHIENAKGGILFIDEAHQLTNQKDTANTFNSELINSLITTLENNRENCLIILAGYREEMKQMLKEVDRGLSSRISRIVDFRDFNHDELLTIFKNMLSEEKNHQNKPFTISPDAEDLILDTISKQKIDAGTNFGNARDMRVLAKKILEGFASLYKDPSETVILKDDLKAILEKDLQKNPLSAKEKHDKYHNNQDDHDFEQ